MKTYFSLFGVSLYRKDIGDYMHRWILKTPLGMIRLHKILRSDSDRTWHDHSSNLLSFILWGTYREQFVPTWWELYHEDYPRYIAETSRWGHHEIFNPELHESPALDDIRRPLTITRTKRAPTVNWIPAKRYHRLEVLRGPVWTLVFMGKFRRRWSFLDQSGKVTDYEVYLKENVS